MTALLEEVRNIVQETNVRLGDEAGKKKPNIGKTYFYLNGWAADDEAHETFGWSATTYGDCFCKTLQKPYDAVVKKILEAAKEIYGDDIDVCDVD